MYKKINFQQRLDLLIISIESLHLYAQQHIYYEKFQVNKINSYLILMLYNSYTLHNFNDRIIMIYKIYNSIKRTFLQEIIQQILYDYCSSKKSIIALKYCKRFKHIYQRTQNYYNHASYYKQFTCEQLAIVNLYILNQVSNNGFYFLIKYLLNL